MVYLPFYFNHMKINILVYVLITNILIVWNNKNIKFERKKNKIF